MSQSCTRATAAESPIDGNTSRKPILQPGEAHPAAVVADDDEGSRKDFAAVLNDIRNKHAADPVPESAVRSKSGATAAECLFNDNPPLKPVLQLGKAIPADVAPDADERIRKDFATVLNEIRSKHATDRVPEPTSQSNGSGTAGEAPIAENPPRKPAQPSGETKPVAVVAGNNKAIDNFFASVLRDLHRKMAPATPRVSSQDKLRRNACQGLGTFAHIAVKDVRARCEFTREDDDNKRDERPKPEGEEEVAPLTSTQKQILRHKPPKPVIKKHLIRECALAGRGWVKLLSGFTFIAYLCSTNRDRDNLFLKFRHLKRPVKVSLRKRNSMQNQPPASLGVLFCVPLKSVADMSVSPFLELLI